MNRLIEFGLVWLFRFILLLICFFLYFFLRFVAVYRRYLYLYSFLQFSFVYVVLSLNIFFISLTHFGVLFWQNVCLWQYSVHCTLYSHYKSSGSSICRCYYCWLLLFLLEYYFCFFFLFCMYTWKDCFMFVNFYVD